MIKVALTTFDNPFNPISQFDDWLKYDISKSYNSCALLARIAHTTDYMTEEETTEELERAIDEIIKYDFENRYKKVKENVKEA